MNEERELIDEIQDILFFDKIYFLSHLTISENDFNLFRNTLSRLVRNYQVYSRYLKQDRLYIISKKHQEVITTYLDYWEHRKSEKNISYWNIINSYLTILLDECNKREGGQQV